MFGSGPSGSVLSYSQLQSSRFTMLTGPDGGAAASAPSRRIKCCRQCAGLGWTFLLKNKNGPKLFTTLTMICMGPLVAGRKWWDKEDWSLSLPENNID